MSPNIEYEAKFLNIDHSDLRKKLKSLGAVCKIPERTMRRVILDYPDRRLGNLPSRLRLRDEGDKVTMTYKYPSANKFEYETEIIVDSFDKSLELMHNIGFEVTTKVENRRETWQLGGGEVVLDTWPWVHPFIEIESSSEQLVRSSCEELGLDWSTAVFGDFDAVCRAQYSSMPTTASAYDNKIIDFNQSIPSDWL